MSTWTGRAVVVTGAEGFIGSTLVDRLVAEGAQVRAFVHYKPYGPAGHLAGAGDAVEVVAGDVRDAGQLADTIDGAEVVFHLAALIGIPYSYQAPESYVQTNVVGTHNVAAACQRHGARLVNVSTSEVYGTAREVPIREDHPLQPQSPYSASKIGAEMMALSYAHAFETPVTVVRPFNTYGPRQSGRAIIPTILGQLLAGAREVRLGATKPTRDFNYVDDTVAGMLAMAACDQAIGQVVNIGSGHEISIEDLARLLIEITGGDAELIVDEARLRPAGSEVERLLADNSRIRAWTGWAPQVSLAEGLRRTAAWLSERPSDGQAARYQV